MPNWCQNQLTVTGATPELRAWLEDGFSFQRMKPVHQPETNESSPGDRWSLSEAQCSAWGTKWDLDETEQAEAASELLDCGNTWFDTAWTPPLEALSALSARFPDETFVLDYHEPGNGFAGRATFEGGGCDDESTEEPAEVSRIARETFGMDWDED
jgi:hypothetical protein